MLYPPRLIDAPRLLDGVGRRVWIRPSLEPLVEELGPEVARYGLVRPVLEVQRNLFLNE